MKNGEQKRMGGKMNQSYFDIDKRTANAFNEIVKYTKTKCM